MVSSSTLEVILEIRRRVVVTFLVVGLVAIGYLLWDASRAARSTGPNNTPQNETRQTEGPAPIRIAFNTWIGYSAFYVAEEYGLFAKYGISVETQVIDPLAEKNAGMVRGDLDGMGGTIDSAVISSSVGVDGKVVFVFDRSNGTDGILVAEEIRSIQDLRGRTVAVEEGFVGHLFLLYVLDSNGIPSSEVEILPMTTDQAGAAFAAGRVDVAVTWEPYLTTAAQRPGAHVLVSSADVEPILADTLFLSQKFLERRRDEAVALVAALQEANERWLTDMDTVNKIVARRWGMTLEEVSQIMATDELYDGEMQAVQLGSPRQRGRLFGYLETCAKLWRSAGVISGAIDVTSLVDRTIYSDARELTARLTGIGR